MEQSTNLSPRELVRRQHQAARAELLAAEMARADRAALGDVPAGLVAIGGAEVRRDPVLAYRVALWVGQEIKAAGLAVPLATLRTKAVNQTASPGVAVLEVPAVLVRDYAAEVVASAAERALDDDPERPAVNMAEADLGSWLADVVVVAGLAPRMAAAWQVAREQLDALEPSAEALERLKAAATHFSRAFVARERERAAGREQERVARRGRKGGGTQAAAPAADPSAPARPTPPAGVPGGVRLGPPLRHAGARPAAPAAGAPR